MLFPKQPSKSPTKNSIELNRQLYLQKVHGYKKESYYLSDSVFEAITSGDIEKLKILISSGMVKLSTEMRILSEDHFNNMKYHFVIIATLLAESSLGSGLHIRNV